jgi:predicted aconitase
VPAYPLFNAETPTAPATSQPIQWSPELTGGAQNILTFQIIFSAAPSAAVVEIIGSNVNVLADFTVVYTSTFSGTNQADVYTNNGNYLFYAAKLVSHTGTETLTVLVN